LAAPVIHIGAGIGPGMARSNTCLCRDTKVFL